MTSGEYKFEANIGATLVIPRIGTSESPIVPAAGLGYCYQPRDGGFFFRAGLGVNYVHGAPLQISMGHAF